MATTASTSSVRHRRRLVRELELAPGSVADAFVAVPRELFVPEWVEQIGLAEIYRPHAVLVTQRDSNGMPTSSSSAPAIMAPMLVDLDVQPGHRVLEIGAGTGYNAALLAELVGRNGSVTSVELDPATAARARSALRRAGVRRARVVVGDGHDGHPDGAPYDRIIATAASPTVPHAWFDQLVDGGLVQLPYQRVGLGAVPTLVKHGNSLDTRSVRLGGFMSMRRGVDAVAPRQDQVVVSQVRNGRARFDAIIGGPVERMSNAARRQLQRVLADEPVARRWREPDPSGYLLLGAGAAQCSSSRGWGAAVIDRGGASVAAVVKAPSAATSVVRWGDVEPDLLGDALTTWRALGRPTLERLRLRVDFPDGAGTARVRHSWRPSAS